MYMGEESSGLNSAGIGVAEEERNAPRSQGAHFFQTARKNKNNIIYELKFRHKYAD